MAGPRAVGKSGDSAAAPEKLKARAGSNRDQPSRSIQAIVASTPIQNVMVSLPSDVMLRHSNTTMPTPTPKPSSRDGPNHIVSFCASQMCQKPEWALLNSSNAGLNAVENWAMKTNPDA